MTLIPFVVEQDGWTERAYDIHGRLLKDHIVFIGSEKTDDVANVEVSHSIIITGKMREEKERP